MKWVIGTDLPPKEKVKALNRFIHRFTADHIPEWATKPHKGKYYPVQFKSDQDWLAHTEFAITKAGLLSESNRYCRSYSTWPQGAGFKEKPFKCGDI